MTEWSRRVFDAAREVVTTEVVDPSLRELVLLGLDSFASRLQSDASYHFIHLPLGIHAAVAKSAAPAIPLAAMLTMIFAGFDIVDDLADGDAPEAWRNYSAAERQLAASALFCMLPQLSMLKLDAAGEVRNAMQRELASSMITIAAGQLDDVRSESLSLSRQALESIIAGKTAEQPALYARLAARLAGATEQRVELAGELGRAIGFAAQIASDLFEVMRAGDARAPWGGSPNYLVTLFLEGDSRLDRGRLEAAATDVEIALQLRSEIGRSAATRLAAFEIELHCQRARRFLDAFGGSTAGRAFIVPMIEQLSVFDSARMRAFQKN